MKRVQINKAEMNTKAYEALKTSENAIINRAGTADEFLTFLTIKNLITDVEEVAVGVIVNNGTETKTIQLEETSNGECIKCGSTNIRWDSHNKELEGDFVYRTHTCKDCDSSWEERYDLVMVTLKDGNQSCS